jgi:5-methylcytosine-specific restriction protein B
MMAETFTFEHFELLKQWRGKSRDKTDTAQNDAYEQLKRAYRITERWADTVQKRLFPQGSNETRKSPLNQGGNFRPYNWARIYPSIEAPRGLAITLGIAASDGFEVKIDLVDRHLKDSDCKAEYERLRGDYDDSGIVSILPIEKGLSLTFDELVEWTCSEINSFTLKYDDVARKLGLSETDNDFELLRHFSGHPQFLRRQTDWSAETTALFCRLARAVNYAGLDWWFTKATNSQLRFGRKEKGREKGRPIGWMHIKVAGILNVSWTQFGGLEPTEWEAINEDGVADVENLDLTIKDTWPNRLNPLMARGGFWPDDYSGEDREVEEPDADDESGPSQSLVQNGTTTAINRIYYGPPGTGKTWRLQAQLNDNYTNHSDGAKRFEFVTFHQSYGYEEFVEGLRPVIDSGGTTASTNDKSGSEVGYEIRAGVFLRLCKRAAADPSHQYAIVIDEINRGNISKIFGELITLIEVDKRTGARHEIALTLPYSCEQFSVPPNVDVIGSMNTADRSLALVDTALRRRFEFIEVLPDTRDIEGAPLHDLLIPAGQASVDVRRLLEVLNQRIEALYDRDHTIGHAYFTPLRGKVTEPFGLLQSIFKNKVLPLLEEYFFEDWNKIRLVLGDNQKRDERHQFIQVIDRDNDLSVLFGHDHDLDTYSVRARFVINEQAFGQPESYIGIYDVSDKA